MDKIVAIKKDKMVSYKDETIEYFEEVSSLSQKEDYQTIIDKIKNATETIRIASTTKVDEKIIDAIHENREVNVYMVLKDFKNAKQMIDRFDERRVAIIREVKELENNFILIDNIAYLFINPLDEGKNLISTFDESKASDLNFIFNYYFWNKASKEKLINEILSPIESPFPPFALRRQKFINVAESIDVKLSNLYIPRNKKFETLLKTEISKKYFSDDLTVPLYLNDNDFIVGKFNINKTFSISNSWELKNSKLGDIDSSLEVVIRQESWSKVIKIEEKRDVELGEVISPSIESMDSQEPDEYAREDYVKNIIFHWTVMPPIKPKNAKKASLYKDHEDAKRSKKLITEKQQKNKKLLNEKQKSLSELDKNDKKYKEKLKKFQNGIKELEEKLNQKENIDLPKYELPKVGVLYETNESYFLEISNTAEKMRAKEYVKNQNFSKKIKITV